jgi:pimeloyl-ACP methyl ester carboxylesterase
MVDENAMRWQRDFPNAQVTRAENANHYIQEDAPGALADAVRRVNSRIVGA